MIKWDVAPSSKLTQHLAADESLYIDVNIHYAVCLEQAEGESGVQRKDKQHSLGKKMKAIALTMRRGKKQIKSCSEDMVSHREPQVKFQH